jgi:hypothetical protein
MDVGCRGAENMDVVGDTWGAAVGVEKSEVKPGTTHLAQYIGPVMFTADICAISSSEMDGKPVGSGDIVGPAYVCVWVGARESTTVVSRVGFARFFERKFDLIPMNAISGAVTLVPTGLTYRTSGERNWEAVLCFFRTRPIEFACLLKWRIKFKRQNTFWIVLRTFPPSVVEQDVELAESCYGLCHHVLDVLHLGDVGLDVHGLGGAKTPKAMAMAATSTMFFMCRKRSDAEAKEFSMRHS